MVKKNRFCVMKLHELVKKIMNSSTIVVVEDVISSIIKTILNFMLIQAKEYKALPKYLQAFEYRFRALAEECIF